MTVEAFIENNLSLYYVLLLLSLGFSIFFNFKKEERIKQTGIAKLYSIVSIVFFILFILNYAVSDTLQNLQVSNSSNLGYALFILLLRKIGEYLVVFSYTYPVIALGALVIGISKKVMPKLNFFKRQTTITLGLPGEEKIKQLEKKKKPNFIERICYDEEQNVNETGKLIAKVSQNMAYTMLFLYVLKPLLRYFNINLIFSSITLLFMGITFLELFFALNGSKGELIVEEKNKDNLKFMNFLEKSSLKNLLKFSLVENLGESKRMLHNPQEKLEVSSALICEVPNFEEFKNINMKIMNSAFFENKKVLVICSDGYSVNKYFEHLTSFNAEYDGKIMLKQLKPEDKLFDSFADIYVSTIENCFGNIKILDKLDTIIIEDMDIIMQKKLELLRAFGNIVKMGNSNINYVVLTYMLQGIEATVKNLLLVNNVTWYSTENKQQPDQIVINVWDRKEPEIGDKILGKINKNLGSLIPLALLNLKQKLSRIIVISSDEPINFQLNELNAIKNLNEKEFINDEIEELNNIIELNSKERYFKYKDESCILTNDKYNLYEKIYKLSLINGLKNHINIVSEQYLLRDYMIFTYHENKTRLKHFLPYVPFEVNNSKVVLHDLILQLTNFGVKEEVISRILNENGISVFLGKGNNIRLIAEKLNLFIKNEFDIDIDVYSYITVYNEESKYVFDTSKKNFVEKEKLYVVDTKLLDLFPSDLFKKVNFTKDGFVLEDIEKEYTYNFYQKYLPGQKHCLNGHIYDIKNVIDNGNEVNAILEASTNYDNNTYRQLRKINVLSEMNIAETKINKYTNAISKYMVGRMDFEVDTVGYFEFKNGAIMTSGEYRYVELDENSIKKIKRKHNAANVLKLEFSKSRILNHKIDIIFSKENKDKVAEAIAFLLSEVLVTMLGENANYIQVKAMIGEKESNIDYNWVYPIKLTDYASDNIEIYIFEDVHIERGLIDMIYKNLDNIFGIIYDYLEWSFSEAGNSESIKLKRTKRELHYLRSFETADASLEKFKLAKELLNYSIMK